MRTLDILKVYYGLDDDTGIYLDEIGEFSLGLFCGTEEWLDQSPKRRAKLAAFLRNLAKQVEESGNLFKRPSSAGRKECPLCARVGGPLVKCVVCGRAKAPRGRAVSLSSDYCSFHECDGYSQDPQPEELWPNEVYGESLGHMDWHEQLEEDNR